MEKSPLHSVMKGVPDKAAHPYFSPQQVADRWGTHRRTVIRRIAEKKLIAHKFGGRLFISERDLLDYERLNRQG